MISLSTKTVTEPALTPPEYRTQAEIVAEQEAEAAAARAAELTPARIAEMERERELAAQARIEASKPKELKPGTKIKVHVRGWMYDDTPAEVVGDNMDPMNRQITAKRIHRNGREEEIVVRFDNVSLWRGDR